MYNEEIFPIEYYQYFGHGGSVGKQCYLTVKKVPAELGGLSLWSLHVLPMLA